VLGVAGVVLLSALVAPRILGPLEKLLALLLKAVTTALTYVVLTVTYYLVLTPMGLLMRLFRRDPLNLRFDPDAESYWVPVEPDGPADRPDKPY